MNYHKRLRPLLGTFVEIGISTLIKDDESKIAFNAGFNAIEKVQRLLSFHDPDSELSHLNYSRGKFVKLHPLSIQVLRLAKMIANDSNHLFNCTVGGALVNKDLLPKHTNTNFLEAGINSDIELHADRARLRRDVLITLDGIAKGYAIDYAIFTLKKYNVLSGWVNAGGDLRVFGKMSLPIHRREINGNFSNLGKLQNAALATSSLRLHYDNNFPGYIISSHKNKLIEGTWSVLARRSWLADALTKVASLANQQERTTLIEQLGGKLIYPSTH